MATKLPPVDVVLVGFGWTASILGQELTDAGLQVLALERGAFRDTVPDFATTRIQDELRYAVRNLSGQKTAVTQDNPTGLAMPAFDWKLGNDEIADLATYLRSAWGNTAGAVSRDNVADTRSTVVAARTK